MTETTEIKVCVICDADALNGVALCDKCYHDADCSGPKLEKLIETAEKFRAHFSTLTKERDELQFNAKDHSHKVSTLIKAKEKFRQLCEVKDQQLDELKHGLGGEIDTLQNVNNVLKAKVGDLNYRAQEDERTIINHEKEMDALKSQLSNRDKEIELLKSDIKSKHKTITHLKEIISNPDLKSKEGEEE